MAKSRAQWSGRLSFVLAAAGSAIGLGNLWKFPYITLENNGGAFVLVYLAAIALVGAPIMALSDPVRGPCRSRRHHRERDFWRRVSVRGEG